MQKKINLLVQATTIVIFLNFTNDAFKIDFQFQLHSNEVAILHCH